MLDKQTLLNEVSNAARVGAVTEAELTQAFHQGNVIPHDHRPSSPTDTQTTNTQPKKEGHINTTQILYVIGSAIILLGIIILITTNWNLLSTPVRIIITLGSSLAAYIVGSLFIYAEKHNSIGQAFHAISAVLLPLGLGVLFYEIEFEPASFNVATWIFGISYLAMIASLSLYKSRVFILFSNLFGISLFFTLIGDHLLLANLVMASLMAKNIISYRMNKDNKSGAFFMFMSILFGGGLYSSLVLWLVDTNPALFTDRSVAYMYIVFGIALGSVAFSLSRSIYKKMSSFWYLVSTLSFYGSAFYLSGLKPNQSLLWEILLAGLIFGGIFLSTFLRSKMVLFISSFALIGYIIKITAEYFVDSIGWPFALVIIGLALIGIGYLSFYLNKKYLKRN